MPKKNATKPAKKTQSPKRVENPSWLTADPIGRPPPPPVETLGQALPYLSLTWENFERLCRRLASRSGEVEKAWCYGSTGHTQFGIDILVRNKDGTCDTRLVRPREAARSLRHLTHLPLAKCSPGGHAGATAGRPAWGTGPGAAWTMGGGAGRIACGGGGGGVVGRIACGGGGGGVGGRIACGGGGAILGGGATREGGCKDGG